MFLALVHHTGQHDRHWHTRKGRQASLAWQRGTGASLIRDAHSWTCMQASNAAMLRGLALSAACGVSYGLYSPAYNIATNDPWNMAGSGTAACTKHHACMVLVTLASMYTPFTIFMR